MEAFAERSLPSILARKLAKWMEKRFPPPVSRNTARRRLVTRWRWARKQSYLTKDVMTETEQTEAAREQAGVIGPITHSDTPLFCS